jgi:hypothetical protein
MDPLSELPDGMARALKALDADAARRAAAVDPERVAERVLARLRQEPAVAAAGPLAWATPRALRVAAAVVVLAAGTMATILGGRGSQPGGAGKAGVALPIWFSGDTLTQRQAEAVLKVIEEGALLNDTAPRPSTVSVGELSEEELRALLQAMQSGEGAL